MLHFPVRLHNLCNNYFQKVLASLKPNKEWGPSDPKVKMEYQPLDKDVSDCTAACLCWKSAKQEDIALTEC